MDSDFFARINNDEAMEIRSSELVKFHHVPVSAAENSVWQGEPGFLKTVLFTAVATVAMIITYNYWGSYSNRSDIGFYSNSESQKHLGYAQDQVTAAEYDGPTLGEPYQRRHLLDAIKEFNDALWHDPTNTDALVGLSESWCKASKNYTPAQRLGILHRAKQYALDALETNPAERLTRSSAYTALGQASEDLGEYAEALAAFDNSQALSPDESTLTEIKKLKKLIKDQRKLPR